MRERAIVVPRRYPADAEPGDFEAHTESQALCAHYSGEESRKDPGAHAKSPLPGDHAIAIHQPVRRFERLENLIGEENVWRAHRKPNAQRESRSE